MLEGLYAAVERGGYPVNTKNRVLYIKRSSI